MSDFENTIEAIELKRRTIYEKNLKSIEYLEKRYLEYYPNKKGFPDGFKIRLANMIEAFGFVTVYEAMSTALEQYDTSTKSLHAVKGICVRRSGKRRYEVLFDEELFQWLLTLANNDYKHLGDVVVTILKHFKETEERR